MVWFLSSPQWGIYIIIGYFTSTVIVKREVLFIDMGETGITTELINLTRLLMKNFRGRVKGKNNKTEPFEIIWRVWQGILFYGKV